MQFLRFESHPWCNSSDTICQQWLAKHKQNRNSAALLYSSLPYSPGLCSTLPLPLLYFYSPLPLLYFYSTSASTSTLLCSTSFLLYSTLLCSTLTLLFFALLLSTLLFYTLLYSTLLYLCSISTIPLQYITQGPTGHNDLCAHEHVTSWSLNQVPTGHHDRWASENVTLRSLNAHANWTQWSLGEWECDFMIS